MALPLAIQASEPAPEVRFVFAAPSPYTGRFDATRAGLGIALELQRLAREQALPVRIGLRALPLEADRAAVQALLEPPPRVLVVGGSTWSQGSAAPLRRLFELGGGISLQGVRATAFATAGGAHTGGEMVVLDSLRSLMGQGALGFTSGQRLMVFSTDERLDHPAGTFTPLDCWAMGQYARELLLQAYASPDPAQTAALASRLGVDLTYFRRFPRTLASLPPASTKVCAQINALAGPSRPGLAAVASALDRSAPEIRTLFAP
jgi:hypothetical protein